MNATKRKFNALLQGLGARPESSSLHSLNNASDASLAESDDAIDARMAADLEFFSKRRRVVTPGSTARKAAGTADTAPHPTSASPTSISNVVLRKWTPTGSATAGGKRPVASAAAGTPTEPSRYCPGDRAQLLRRLATFQELTEWTPKPERASEVEWAKKGWECRGRERVRCVLCEMELVVRLNRKEVDGKEVAVLVPGEIEDALVEKYVELMVTAHQDDCLWRRRGCDDSLLRVPVFNPKSVLSGLRQRYDELLARKDFLPYEFNLRLPSGLDLDKIASYLPPDFFANLPPNPQLQPTTTPTSMDASSQPPPPNRVALSLALLGWQSLLNPRTAAPVHSSASCHTCLRRLGLWMFKSKEVDPATNAVLVPAPMEYLDPLREHRFFCPWKNGSAQTPSSGAAPQKGREPAKPTWELVVDMLRNEAHLRERAAAAAAGSAHARSRSDLSVAAPGMPAPRTTGATTTTTTTTGDPPVVLVDTDGASQYTVEDAAVREAKDKERWARLRKVKSFFHPKDGKKLKRLSRPGTSASSIGGGA